MTITKSQRWCSVLLSAVLIFTLIFGLATTNVSAKAKNYITITSPKNGVTNITITSKAPKALWDFFAKEENCKEKKDSKNIFSSVSLYSYHTAMSYSEKNKRDFKKIKSIGDPDPYQAKGVSISWKSNKTGTFIVKYSTNSNLSGAKTISTKNKKATLNDLYRNMTYYVQVSLKNTSLRSSTIKFTTAKVARIMDIDNVYNARDLGGYYWYDDNGVQHPRTKQGKIFRSAQLEGHGSTPIITTNEKSDLKRLGIKTELDLRTQGQAEKYNKKYSNTNKPTPIYKRFDGVEPDQIQNASNAQKNSLAQQIKVFADKNNYPIIIHCINGRDRTGMVAFLINGVIGVNKQNLYRDYRLTYLSQRGLPDTKRSEDFDKMYAFMDSYGEKKPNEMPLRKNIELYLKHIGVTQAEINSIRNILTN